MSHVTANIAYIIRRVLYRYSITLLSQHIYDDGYDIVARQPSPPFPQAHDNYYAQFINMSVGMTLHDVHKCGCVMAPG